MDLAIEIHVEQPLGRRGQRRGNDDVLGHGGDPPAKLGDGDALLIRVLQSAFHLVDCLLVHAQYLTALARVGEPGLLFDFLPVGFHFRYQACCRRGVEHALAGQPHVDRAGVREQLAAEFVFGHGFLQFGVALDRWRRRAYREPRGRVDRD